MTINFKKIVKVVAIVLVCVIACGVTSRLTNGFTEFGKQINEENLLYDKYSNMKTTTDSNGMTVSQDKGVISIKGKTAADTGTRIKIATLELEPGTYTYTCFDKPTTDTYFSYIEYTDADSVVNHVFADFDSIETTASGVTQHAKTFTLAEKTTVTVYIGIAQNYECDAKAYPVLVSGTEAGEFYK